MPFPLAFIIFLSSVFSVIPNQPNNSLRTHRECARENDQQNINVRQNCD